MFTALAFEHTHGLACARIQHLTNEAGHCIASRAAVVGVRRLIADFIIEYLAKFQANDLKPWWNGFYAKCKGLFFGLRKLGRPRQTAGRTCKYLSPLIADCHLAEIARRASLRCSILLTFKLGHS
jgi:hypothetical protein